MPELLRKKRLGEIINKESIINEINIFIFMLIENNVNIDIRLLVNCLNLLFQRKNEFSRYLQVEIKEDIYALAYLISDMNSEDINIIKDVTYKCMDIYIYETSEKTRNISNESKYYSATIAEYYIVSLLNNNMQDYKNFVCEFKNIGIDIGHYYKNQDCNLLNIIREKINKCFEKHNFFYGYPMCLN